MARLKGYSKLPFVRMSRCYDGTPLTLSSVTQNAPGFWQEAKFVAFNQLPGFAELSAMYRFFRIKRVLIEYTPNVRTDEYAKLFVSPTGAGANWFISHGGSLEMKCLNYFGAQSAPTTWADVLNKSGSIRKCPSTKPFRVSKPCTISQEIHDDEAPADDPVRVIKAPWLACDHPTNQSLAHWFGWDCFHSTNNLSYDQAQPVVIQRRYVVDIEFKGLKI